MPRSNRGRDIFEVDEVMDVILEITDREENRYSDIPGWTGSLTTWSDRAACLLFNDGRDIWFPLSHLRKAGDGQSIYASNWILEQKGLG